MANLAGDGEDAAGRGVPDGGEAKTSPEIRTVWLVMTSLVELRLKLRIGVQDLRMGDAVVAGVRSLPKLGKIAGVEKDCQSCGGG
jgi:hypothetical protein